MISAFAAESHRFGRVKRNGYDPAEVDAVIARLIETLRKYDKKTKSLEQRIAEADGSVEAIRRTLIVAEHTSDEILAEAEAEATQALDTARAEATELKELAEALGVEVASERERILSRAYAEAEELTAEAETSAARRTIAAVAETETLLEAASITAADRIREAAATHRAVTIAAAWMTRRAHEQGRAIVADAHTAAAKITHAAQIEDDALRARIAAIRSAVVALESAASDLAHKTSGDASVIDLKAVEALGDEAQPASEPPSQVPERVFNVAQEHSESDPNPVDAERPSFYRKSTGTSLRERIRIARMSG